MSLGRSFFGILIAGLATFCTLSSGCAGDSGGDRGGDGEGVEFSTTGCGPDAPATVGGYCVSGNQILDESGAPKIFRGVNRPSLEWSKTGEGFSPEDFQEMAVWNANIVRIPLNQAYLLTEVVAREYETRVAEVVGWARDAGLHVILDLHRAPLVGGEVNEQQDMTNEDSLTFWEEIASTYKDDPEVSFELYNEPRGITWTQWRDGGTHSDGWTIVGMQRLYDAIRATGAHNLILVGGLNWAYDLKGLLEIPLDGYNIVYVTHLYGYGGKRPEDWQDDWLFLADQYPLFISEFGPHVSDPEPDLEYTAAVMDTADAYALSWTAWAWFNFSTNNIIEGPWTTDPSDYTITEYGQQVRDRLGM